MDHLLPITNDPNLDSKRTAKIKLFSWNIYENLIKVVCETYYTLPNGTLLNKPEPFVRTLQVDDADYINLDNGEVVFGQDYNAAPESYPNVVGQYTGMMNLTLGDLKAQGMVIDDTTKVSDILFALIDKNVIDSSNRGKFDI